MARTLYRIVRTNPPTVADFLSHERRGQPIPRNVTPELRESWTGVSMHDTREASRAVQRRFPRIGSFIAALMVEDEAPVRVKQTGTDPHHYDVWAEPGELLARVVAVDPI